MSVRRFAGVVAIVVGAVGIGACAPDAPGGTWLAAGCFGSPSADAPDLRYSGAVNRVDNLTVALDLATFTLSSNGTCAGIPLEAPYAFTLVRGADATNAAATCESLGLTDGVGQLTDDYPGFPADAWVCNPAVST